MISLILSIDTDSEILNLDPCSLQKYNTELLVDMVRQQFKKNMHETDPEKIQKLKDE